MMANTTAKSTGMATAKISADFVSRVKAMSIAPKTTMGERSSQPERQIEARLHLIHVARHARDERGRAEPVKLGVGQRLDVREKRMAQAGQVAPVAALAEKYCAHVGAGQSPHRPSPTSTRHFFRIYAVSPDEMPTSMIFRHDERHPEAQTRPRAA